LKSKKDKLWASREKTSDFSTWDLAEQDLKTFDQWKTDEIEAK